MIFALIGYAHRKEDRGGIVHRFVSITNEAKTEEKALCIAHKKALERYPESDGYTQHGGDALMVPHDWVMMAAHENIIVDMCMRGMSGNDYSDWVPTSAPELGRPVLPGESSEDE